MDPRVRASVLLFLLASIPACSTHSVIPAADGGADDSAAPTGGGEDGGADAAKSGTDGGTGGTNVTCAGGYSAQLSEAYDDACDDLYRSGPEGLPCTPSGNQCVSLNGQEGFGVFCCYAPPAGSNCDYDYHGTPQCIPQ